MTSIKESRKSSQSPRRSRSDGLTMTRGGRKSGKEMHEPNAASTEAQMKRRSNLLAIGVRSGGVWKVGVTGTLKLIRQMELKRTIDKNPGAQDPDAGIS